MLESNEIANIVFNSYIKAFEILKPYLVAAILGMIGLTLIKLLIGKLIEFFMFESSAAEIRKTKKSAFNLIDLISSLSDIFSKKNK